MRKHLFLINKGSCGLGIDLAPANAQAISTFFAVFAISSEILVYNKINEYKFSGKEDV
jgi:hypothetical protein